MDNIIQVSQEVIKLTLDGDLMGALTYYEENIRDLVADIDTYENQELLDILKSQAALVDAEDWQAVLENVERMDNLLNG